MLEDVVFSQIRHGTEEAVVHAKSLHGTDDNSLFTLEGADARRLGPRPVHITGGNALYDPRTQILTILDNVVVETAEIKSQYSSEAVDQVLLRVRALDWCVRMMKLATEEDIMLIAKLYILRRTERNEDFASGQKTPDSKVGTVIVNTYYL